MNAFDARVTDVLEGFEPEHAVDFAARSAIAVAMDGMVAELAEEMRRGPCVTDWSKTYQLMNGWAILRNARQHLERHGGMNFGVIV